MAKDEFSSSSSTFRLVILVVLLLLVGVAFAYDRLVAKRTFDEVWAKVDNIDDEMGQKTSKDIQELIGKSPALTTTPADREDLVVETYKWRRGLPILTYDLHVIYTKGGENTYFYSAVANADPKQEFPAARGGGIEIREDPPPLMRAGAPTDPPDGVPTDPPDAGEKKDDKAGAGDEKSDEKAGEKKDDPPKDNDKKDDGKGDEKKEGDKKSDDGSDQ